MKDASGKLIRFDSTVERLNGSTRGSSVCVLMSTYNGEHYVEEQISSIAAQDEVSVFLKVRDDGSSDRTIEITSNSAEKYGIDCFIERGSNLGFLDSFEKLLLEAEGHDYYAFSDQDDVWDSRKLKIAVRALEGSKETPALYASSVVITDENLSPISRNDFPGFTYSIRSEFVRHRLAGHTMVWNDSLQKKIRAIGRLSAWSHDQHIVLAGLLSSAALYLDSASYVKHRRLPGSITPGGGSPMKRIRHELEMTLNVSGKFDRCTLATELLELRTKLGREDIEFLRSVTSYKQSFASRIGFAFSPLLSCGMGAGDLEARAAVLLGRF